MEINNKFEIAEEVSLRNDSSKSLRYVTRIQVGGNGLIYALSYIGTETWHYDFEIEKYKAEQKPLGFNTPLKDTAGEPTVK